MALSAKQTTVRAASRFTLDPKRKLALAEDGESVAPGVGKAIVSKADEDHLVYTFGGAVSAIPAYAVATAFVAGSVYTYADIVGAFVEFGSLDRLKAEIAKHDAAVAKSAK